MFCPKCGTKLDNSAKVCTTCGNIFENNTAPTEPVMQQGGDVPPMQSYPSADVPPQAQIPDTPPQMPVAQVKKSHKGLIIVLSIVLVLTIAGSLLLYFNPGGIFGGDDDDDDDSSSKGAKESSSMSQEGSLISDSSSDSDSSESDSSSDTDSSSDDDSSDDSSDTTTTTADTSSEPDETTTASSDDSSDSTDTTTSAPDDSSTTTTAGQPGGADEDEDYKEAMKYSTNDRPSFREFEWCYGQLDLVRKMPAGATQIKTANRMAGGWKSMFIYGTSKNSDMIAREVNNIIIDPTADEVNMTIDWYLMEIPNSENVPEENLDDTTFTVKIGSNGALTGEPKGGTLVISEFWNDGNNDYAVGEYQTDSGVYAYVALYR